MTHAIMCDRCRLLFEMTAHMHEMDIFETGKGSRVRKRTVHLCDNCISWFDDNVKGVPNGIGASGQAGRDACDD